MQQPLQCNMCIICTAFRYASVMLTVSKRSFTVSPHKNHIHHLLLKTGLKHRQVTFVLIVVSLFFIALGLVAKNWEIVFWCLLLCDCCVLTYILWLLSIEKILLNNSTSIFYQDKFLMIYLILNYYHQ
jgi:hypothetical protein